MNVEDELKEQVTKHLLKMDNVFKNIRVALKENGFKELFELARAYFSDAKHFYDKSKLVQSFEALMISWAYLDAGLRLDIFELTDDSLKDYFTKE